MSNGGKAQVKTGNQAYPALALAVVPKPMTSFANTEGAWVHGAARIFAKLVTLFIEKNSTPADQCERRYAVEPSSPA